MKPRKTFEVAALLEKVNTLLSAPESAFNTPEVRKGAASVLETVLMATNNYHGYEYLGWRDGGYAKWVADGSPRDTTPYLGDETRRCYAPAPVAVSAKTCPNGLKYGTVTEDVNRGAPWA